MPDPRYPTLTLYIGNGRESPRPELVKAINDRAWNRSKSAGIVRMIERYAMICGDDSSLPDLDLLTGEQWMALGRLLREHATLPLTLDGLRGLPILARDKLRTPEGEQFAKRLEGVLAPGSGRAARLGELFAFIDRVETDCLSGGK